MKLEKEIQKLKRENKTFKSEVERLNDLIEQMKNIQDDELLMIEKISTKEIYGKAQKIKISDLQKETEKIRIEISRLKIINNNQEKVISEKDSYIDELKKDIENLKKNNVKTNIVYRTEYKDRPETVKHLHTLETIIKNREEEIVKYKTSPPQIKTVYRDNPNSEEITRLRTTLSSKDQLLLNKNNDIQNLQNMNKQKDKQINNMNDQIKQMQEQLKKSQNNKNNEYDLQNALNQMEDQLKKAQMESARYKNLLAGSSDQTEKLRRTEQELNNLKQNSGDLNELNKLQVEYVKLKNKLENLNAILQEKDSQLAYLKSSLFQKEKLNDQLNKQLSETDHPLQINSLKQENEQLKKSNLMKNDEIKKLIDAINKLENENKQLRLNQNDPSFNMENQLKLKQEHLDKIMEENKKSNNNLLEIKNQQLDQMQDNINFFKKQLNDLREEMENMRKNNQNKINDLDDQIKQKDQDLKNIKTTVNQLEQELQEKNELLKKFETLDIPGK